MSQLPHLELRFRNLASAGYDPTSAQTKYPPTPGAYNCIAWAVEDPRNGNLLDSRFWWPEGHYTYWPTWINPKENTVECFVRTFRWFGYEVCSNSKVESGYDKLVLYAIHAATRAPCAPPRNWRNMREWEPTHMARQLPDGTWTSKLGGAEDITHFTLDAVESYGPPHGWSAREAYGCPVVYMKRRKSISKIIHHIQLLDWKLAPVRRRIRKAIRT